MLLADDLLGEMLAELINRPAWQADALCREYPDIDFFPTRTGPQKDIKAICDRCLVQTECLEAAVERRDPWGIWGGTTAKQRQRIRRERRLNLEGAM